MRKKSLITVTGLLWGTVPTHPVPLYCTCMSVAPGCRRCSSSIHEAHRHSVSPKGGSRAGAAQKASGAIGPQRGGERGQNANCAQQQHEEFRLLFCSHCSYCPQEALTNTKWSSSELLLDQKAEQDTGGGYQPIINFRCFSGSVLLIYNASKQIQQPIPCPLWENGLKQLAFCYQTIWSFLETQENDPQHFGINYQPFIRRINSIAQQREGYQQVSFLFI